MRAVNEGPGPGPGGPGPTLLQAKALRVGDGDGQLVFELLPGPVRRQADLVEAGVGDRQPWGGTQRRSQQCLSAIGPLLGLETNPRPNPSPTLTLNQPIGEQCRWTFGRCS